MVHHRWYDWLIVICAHCATEGHCADIEKSGRARVEAFDMFLRLMDEPKYKKLLFADISSITAFLRAQYVERLLDRTDIHDRLLFATDYPVPAVWIVVWTRKIRKLGLINGTHSYIQHASDNPIAITDRCTEIRLGWTVSRWPHIVRFRVEACYSK